MNTRAIKKALKNDNIRVSESHGSRISGWGSSSEGAEITPDVIITGSETKIRGKWVTYQKQTGVFAITYTNSTYITANEKNRKDPKEMVKIIYATLIKVFGKENVTLDLDGKYTIYGKEQTVGDSPKVIVGDIEKLKLKHF